jgi:hypothetical protein
MQKMCRNSQRQTRAAWMMLEALEPRQLLSDTFSNSDASGIWTLAGMGSMGTVQFDGAGNIVGGAITDDSGETSATTGTYTVGSTGAFNVSSQSTLSGAMNASKNFIALTTGDDDNGLGLLTTNGGGTFGDADLSGNWHLFVNGDSADNDGLPNGDNDNGNTGQGIVNFNGAGGVISGTFVKDDNGASDSITGNYSVSSAGDVSLNVQSENSLSFIGAMSSTKDAVILNPSDLASAASTNDSRLLALIHSQGKYSDATMDGTWTAAFDDGQATLNFNGAGKITGTATTSDGSGPLTGKYTVSSSGTFTVSIIQNGKTNNFSGAIDASHDVAAMTKPKSGKDDTLVVLISSEPANHAPTLTKISSFKTAHGGQPFTISYASLSAVSNAADLDGDAIGFQITSLGGGTLTLDGAAATVGSVISTGESVVWTPAANAKGTLSAFDVKAFDGTITSKSAVAVKVVTVSEPDVQITANKKKVFPVAGNKPAADGLFTLKRSGGETSAPLTVSYSIGGSAVAGTDYAPLSGSITFAAGMTSATITAIPLADAQADAPVTLVLTLSPSDDIDYAVDSKLSSATITITE